MLKPSGRLSYFMTVAGAGGKVTKDLLVDDDDSGDHFDPNTLSANSALVLTQLQRWFSAEGVAMSGDRSLTYISGVNTSTDSENRLTKIEIEVTNDSTGAGDLVSGHLYIDLPQVGNYGA